MRRRIRIKVSESYARFTIYLFSFSPSHSLHPLCYAVEWDEMEKLTLADSPSSHMHKIKFNPNLNWNCQSFRFRQCHTHFTAIHLKTGYATTSNALAVCERKHQMTINQCHDCHAASVKRHHKRERAREQCGSEDRTNHFTSLKSKKKILAMKGNSIEFVPNGWFKMHLRQVHGNRRKIIFRLNFIIIIPSCAFLFGCRVVCLLAVHSSCSTYSPSMATTSTSTSTAIGRK